MTIRDRDSCGNTLRESEARTDVELKMVMIHKVYSDFSITELVFYNITAISNSEGFHGKLQSLLVFTSTS